MKHFVFPGHDMLPHQRHITLRTPAQLLSVLMIGGGTTGSHVDANVSAVNVTTGL